MKYITHSEEETILFGIEFAKLLQPGDVIALMGHLGSGKTCLTRGICVGLDVKQPVTSPTFVLINEYLGRYSIYHFDFYRLDSIEEIWDLGVDEYFYRNGICIIEWAEKGLPLLPDFRIEITLSSIFKPAQENVRAIEIKHPAINQQLKWQPRSSTKQVGIEV